MNCKLCETEVLPLYAYPHDIPEIIPFRASVDEKLYKVGSNTFYGSTWLDVNLYILVEVLALTVLSLWVAITQVMSLAVLPCRD